jgi:ribosomal-protein-alanine N-acetyltransferase
LWLGGLAALELLGDAMNTETVMVDAKVHIRWTIRRDMPEVMRIENECFRDFPWSEQDWLTCLANRNCIGMVAEVEECVVGVMVYDLLPKGLHLLNFAVRPDCQRIGIGTALVNKLKSKLSQDRRTRLSLHIRESNLPAQLFFRAQGFRAVSVVKDHYEDTPEDAYLFQYRYQAAAERCVGR